MTPSLFPDVNFWLAHTWERHKHHEATHHWYVSLGEAKLYFSRVTQLSYLRLLTTASVMDTSTHTQVEAWERYDNLVARDDRVSFLPEPPAVEAALRQWTRVPLPSPKEWADAYLLAFAQTAGLTVVTFDRALAGKAGDLAVLLETQPR